MNKLVFGVGVNDLGYRVHVQDFNHRGGELTGYVVLKAMLYTFLTTLRGFFTFPEQVFFHTQNPIGKENMESYWKNFCKHYKEENK